MRDKIQQIREKALAEIDKADGLEKLNDVRAAILGKKGELTAVLKGMKDVAPEDRPKVGQWVNETREAVEKLLDEKVKKFEAEALKRKYESEKIDVTMPAKRSKKGNLHPVTQVKDQLSEIFTSMGFEVYEGTEIENDYYNFTALNTPKDHPARDMQDTFFISKNPDIVLHTHTSSVQVRDMEAHRPPIRLVTPGRVFRNEAISARAHCIFHQIEALYIDENVSFADLKQTLTYFAKELFGPDTQIRLRPSYFPFTEPSAEMDVSCTLCHGKGCNVCKGTGWLEILGCGMVDPNVLELNGIDKEKYTGFALGMGIERITMLKYGIKDIRLFFENDIRFLEQFSAAGK